MFAGRSPACLRSLGVRSQLQCSRQSSLRQHLFPRAFHSSRPNQLFEFLEPVSQTIQWGFHELHTQTGLPWYLTIPLGASIIRMSWVPVLILTSHLRKSREHVTQLLSAWRKAYQETASIKFPRGTLADAKKAEAWVVEQLKKRRQAIRKHERYAGSWVDPALSISFIPIWILSMDCIRRMAGDTRTVTALLWEGSDTVSKPSIVEPGFATESLFWIPSLASADPLWILPLSYGALATYSAWTKVRNTIRQPKSAVPTPLEATAGISKRLSYVMLGLPSIFTCIIIRGDMATALVLYLIGTTVTQLVQRPLLAGVLGTAKKTPTLHAKMARPKAGKGK
ncbi:hypothetical protein H2200_013407 [Cladophialophora chaetospira]|uniref:Mitochondrial export translocase Oxa2 n=1 Tax=Cladophialophora chaetospira TaxID=386627 RepID=A0AA38WPC5_9EURO|nr:hypothetical protein H2200_013407 [Cladophialophora chaetospira]